MYSNFFQSCILEPTSITSKTHDKEVYSGNIIDDHMPNFAIIKNIVHERNLKIRIRDMNHFNENFYQKDLEELKRLDILKYKTVSEMLNTFHEKFLEIIDKYAYYGMVWYVLTTGNPNTESRFCF